jgi:hypothetical protein
MDDKKERDREWNIMEQFTHEWIYLVSILAVIVIVMLMLKDVV